MHDGWEGRHVELESDWPPACVRRYHDSKLTELLSSALGGNSKTTIIVTTSPEPRHATETLQVTKNAPFPDIYSGRF
eukprot:COSAG05_NODE_952_length_6466_cov_3.122350_4_plen_77_part_00